MPVDRCSHIIMITTILQLSSFLRASSNERIVITIMYLIHRKIEKNLLPISRKMRKKNQILEYHVLSLAGTIKKKQD